jgi:hypothetical protein
VNIEQPHWTQPGITERAADPVADVSRIATEIAAVLQAGLTGLGDVLERARQPGKPLATVSAMTRKAPLASLLTAFLLGVAVARRR